MSRPRLSQNALTVLRKRYLKKDAHGRVVESPSALFARVAHSIASAERLYGNRKNLAAVQRQFLGMMTQLEFLPNSPTLMNAGRESQQLAACFVLPVNDSLESIFDAVKQTALIHQSGGGTGFNYSFLRPQNDPVLSTSGVASGPVSFMRVFNMATEVIKQGGTRRGANMGILRVDHPDIEEFITIKQNPHELTNFNLSVGLTDAFLQAVAKNRLFTLTNPHTGRPIRRVRAARLFDQMVHSAWKSGEPGLLFLDRINRDNPTPKVGILEATNPCGEQPLLPYESCNLGSVNLARMTRPQGKRVLLDEDHLVRTIQGAVRFLDNVIDMNCYPLPEIEQLTQSNRKIGLGVMGFADLLIQMGIPYDSPEALQTARRVMKQIQEISWASSEALARERGVFPNFPTSIYNHPGGRRPRNATTTTIAPTGTLSILARCSSGIEPLYAVHTVRTVMDQTRLREIHPEFIRLARRHKFWNRKVQKNLSVQGSIQDIREIPEEIRRLFVTAHDIRPEWHVRMQAAFQEYTDNAVSKTVNFPEKATRAGVRRVFLQAYHAGCKGITIYRSGSRAHQVLSCADPPYC